METIERDQSYIADQVKLLRKLFGLTQQNLADASGLTTRTIEKIETGRHRPEEQTLRSLARALNLDVKIFQKPSPEQVAKQNVDLARAVRKMVLTPIDPVRTIGDFLAAFDQRHAFRFDTSAAQTNEALEAAAAVADFIKDLNDVWDECGMSHRIEYAKSFMELCRQLEPLGLVCYMGHYRQVLREQGRADLLFTVGLMSIQPEEGAEGRRYALVQLEGKWETLDEDRVPLPEGFGA